MTDRIPVIMDGDFGVDDAFALAMAAGLPDMEIVGVTSCFGCVCAERATSNALGLCKLLNLDVPVAMGAAKAMMLPERNFEDPKRQRIHGEDGMGGKIKFLPRTFRKPEDCTASELIARIIKEREDNVVLITTGPLTNIALFLMTYPELRQRVDGIAMAAGSMYCGDVLLTAEANVAADPEAAQVVFQSGMKIVMCGYNATKKAVVEKDDMEMFRLVGGSAADNLCDIAEGYLSYYKHLRDCAGPALNASVPVAWLENSDAVVLTPAYVEVDLAGKYSQASTVVDIRLKDRKPNVMVAMDVNRELIMEIQTTAFRNLGRND